jgi:hypothetical protein
MGIGGRSIGGGRLSFDLLINFDEEPLGAELEEDGAFEDFEFFAEEAGGRCRKGGKYAPLGW